MIFGYAERIATKSPDCRQLRCSLALKTGRTNEFLKLQVQIFKSQEAQTQLTGTLNHNLRVLEPHYHILVGIGSTVHLDTYVKAGVLGMRPPTRTVILHESWLLRYAVNQCMLDYWTPFIDIVEDEDQLRTLRPLKIFGFQRYRTDAVRKYNYYVGSFCCSLCPAGVGSAVAKTTVPTIP